ncbi:MULTISPECIES: TetR/AcrR family transcriptional regulator [Sphingobium]|uniref:Transcriptional regulator n=1 Tax=Sphingobium baderi TaxID=1332080 RepID=A0A0S3F1L7_9SPHN|nr:MULTISPECIES: TetR/AcrR family transcriptional regulator [Sphingobium]ALR21542.1 transcriptional regulator [Sphingobium baderi]
MKVSREQATRNREKVVDAASRLFRARGVDGVAIGEVMRECGLTHGGFYNQFASKDGLAVEACARSLMRSAERWRGIVAETSEGNALHAIAADYLSGRNRDAPETGCALIALGPDAARKGGDLADAFRHGFEALAAILEEADQEGGQEAALARMSQWVGALSLARAVGDPALSDQLLSAARKAAGLAA